MVGLSSLPGRRMITAGLVILNACVILSVAESDPEQLGTAVAVSDDKPKESLASFFKKSRQLRCVRCGYDDQYQDYDRKQYYPSSRGYEDRNWYYYDRRDRYDDRPRYSADRDTTYRYNHYDYGREDDRYSQRNYDRYRYDTRNYYDHSNTRVPERGYSNGYESRNRYVDRYNDDRFYDRYQTGYEGQGRYYDRDYNTDRYPARNDYRTYRPYDETYRGESGFDDYGRGYYNANTKHPDRHPQYNSNSNKYGPPHTVTSTSGPTYLPESRPESARPPNKASTEFDRRPSNDGGSDSSYAGAGGWKYLNEKDNNKSDAGRDGQSSAYGSRPRPLSGAYLHDRDSNGPVAVSDNGMSSDKQLNGHGSASGSTDSKQE